MKRLTLLLVILTGCGSPVVRQRTNAPLVALSAVSENTPSESTLPVAPKISFLLRTNMTLRLVWDPSPDAEVTGYYLYQGSATGSYTNIWDCGNVTNFTVIIPKVAFPAYFSVTARNGAGEESDYSNEVRWPPYPPDCFTLYWANITDTVIWSTTNLVDWSPWVAVTATNQFSTNLCFDVIYFRISQDTNNPPDTLGIKLYNPLNKP